MSAEFMLLPPCRPAGLRLRTLPRLKPGGLMAAISSSMALRLWVTWVSSGSWRERPTALAKAWISLLFRSVIHLPRSDYDSGLTTSRNGKRRKSPSRVQIWRMPCSRISAAICRSCTGLPRMPGSSTAI